MWTQGAVYDPADMRKIRRQRKSVALGGVNRLKPIGSCPLRFRSLGKLPPRSTGSPPAPSCCPVTQGGLCLLGYGAAGVAELALGEMDADFPPFGAYLFHPGFESVLIFSFKQTLQV